MEKRILDNIDGPGDIKKLTIEQLYILANELREEITTTVLNNGGHLASNLGVVELTLALHYVFNTPIDKIVWDVGHQCYAHKIITGRREQFNTIRTTGGISGFPKTEENPADTFNTGHSSTSISAALGLARARDIMRQDNSVIAVIGDGSLGGGMAFEAINDIGLRKDKLIVILNDNKMSISNNVGGISEHLNELRVRPNYLRFKRSFEDFLNSIPGMGRYLAYFFRGVKNRIRMFFLGSTIFEIIGVKYVGPIDGHNIEHLITMFEHIKEEETSVVIHVLTQKGKGYTKAENDPEKYHGVAPYIVETIDQPNDAFTDKTFTEVFSKAILSLAKKR